MRWRREGNKRVVIEYSGFWVDKLLCTLYLNVGFGGIL